MFSKPLILALLVSLSFNGLFGYLSYKFHSDKVVAESKLESAIDANKSLLESSIKADKACTLSDTITSEYKREEGVLQGHTDTLVDKLDSIPKKSPPKQPENKVEASKHEETSVVDLDGKLPSDVVSLLQQSCNSVQGKACSHP